MTDGETQRLDRWLWCARIFKTRTLASKAISTHGVRVTRGEATQLTEKPGYSIRIGDTLGLHRGERIFLLEVAALAERRGPAPEAQTLYIDHSPPMIRKETPAPVAPRESGSGRPTKKERRALDALKDTGSSHA